MDILTTIKYKANRLFEQNYPQGNWISYQRDHRFKDFFSSVESLMSIYNKTYIQEDYDGVLT